MTQSPEPKKDYLKVYRNTFSQAASSLGSYGYCRFNKMLRLCEYMHRFDARTKYPVLGKVKDDRILDPLLLQSLHPSHLLRIFQGKELNERIHNRTTITWTLLAVAVTTPALCPVNREGKKKKKNKDTRKGGSKSV